VPGSNITAGTGTLDVSQEHVIGSAVAGGAAPNEEDADFVNPDAAASFPNGVGPGLLRVASSAGSNVPGSAVTGHYKWTYYASSSITYHEVKNFTSPAATVKDLNYTGEAGGIGVGGKVEGAFGNSTQAINYTYHEEAVESVTYHEWGTFDNPHGGIANTGAFIGGGFVGPGAEGLTVALGFGNEDVSGNYDFKVGYGSTFVYDEVGTAAGTGDSNTKMAHFNVPNGTFPTSLAQSTTQGTIDLQAQAVESFSYDETGTAAGAVAGNYTIHDDGTNAQVNFQENGTFNSGFITGQLGIELGIGGISFGGFVNLGVASAAVNATGDLTESATQDFTETVNASTATITLAQHGNAHNTWDLDLEETLANGQAVLTSSTLSSSGTTHLDRHETGSDPLASYTLTQVQDMDYTLGMDASAAVVSYNLVEHTSSSSTLDETGGDGDCETFVYHVDGNQHGTLTEQGNNGVISFTLANESTSNGHFDISGGENNFHFAYHADFHRHHLLNENGSPNDINFTTESDGTDNFHYDNSNSGDDGNGDTWSSTEHEDSNSQYTENQTGTVVAGVVTLSNYSLTGNGGGHTDSHYQYSDSGPNSSSSGYNNDHWSSTWTLGLGGSGTQQNFAFSNYNLNETVNTWGNSHNQGSDQFHSWSNDGSYNNTWVYAAFLTTPTMGTWTLSYSWSNSFSWYDSSQNPSSGGSSDSGSDSSSGSFTLAFGPVIAAGYPSWFDHGWFATMCDIGIAWIYLWYPGDPFQGWVPYGNFWGNNFWGGAYFGGVDSAVHNLIPQVGETPQGLVWDVNGGEIGVWEALTEFAQSPGAIWGWQSFNPG
jgi:hypothetical protein